MKIYFRYLLIEMLKPLAFCVVAMMALLIIVDLFGSLEEFNEHGASWDVILKYYVALIPSIIPNMLPVSVLFATLYALLTLSRRSELTALQAGGMGPVTLFLPFIVMATICSVFLFAIMGWPATQSDATRSQIMDELRTGGKTQDVARNVIFVDPVFHHIWHIKVLNEKTNQAKDIDVLLRGMDKTDKVKYVANEAVFTGEFWRLRNGRKFEFEEGKDVPRQSAFETLDVPELSTPAITLAYVQAEPDELTLDELVRFQWQSNYLPPAKLAQYNTQLHYLFAFPASIFVLLLFALTMGITTDRRTGAAAGVFNAIFLLLAFVFVMEFFLALGRGNRLHPFLAAWLGPILFAALAIGLMGRKFGWFWQLERQARAWLERNWPSAVANNKDQLPSDQMNLRLKSLQLLLDRVTKKNPDYPGEEAQPAKESVSEDAPPTLPTQNKEEKAEVQVEELPPALPQEESPLSSTEEKLEAGPPPLPEKKQDESQEEETPPPFPVPEKAETKPAEEELPPALPTKDQDETPPALPQKEEEAPPPLPEKTPAESSAEVPPPLPSDGQAASEDDTPPPLPGDTPPALPQKVTDDAPPPLPKKS